MPKIEIKNRFTGAVILCGEYESIKDCLEKNTGACLGGAYLRDADLRDADLGGADLRDADLRGAYLRDADLRDADLRGAYLGGAYLRDAKGYVNSHDFFTEIIRRQKVEDFTTSEWAMIGVILVHRICWDSIQKRYDGKIMPVFKKLAKVGFGEWEEKYKEITNAK